MHRLPLFLITSFLLSPQTSLAKEKLYCHNIKELQASVTDCDQNEYFAEAGVLCLEALEAEVKIAKAKLSASMTARNKATKKAQGKTFDTSEGNYANAASVLAALIVRTQSTIKEVRRFAENLAMPEDADEPEVTGQSLEQYLDSEPCFSESRDVLDNVLTDLNEHLKDLQATQATSQAHELGSAQREAGVGSGLSGPLVKSQLGQGNKSSAPLGHGRRPSDISGTEKLKKKR